LPHGASLARGSQWRAANDFFGGADEGLTDAQEVDEDKSPKPESQRSKKGTTMNTRTLASILIAACLVAPAAAFAQAASRTSAAGKTAVVNINTASAEQIALLPRVGLKVAARVVEYRKKNGAFRHLEDLMEVQGIGEKLFLALKPHLAIDGSTTLTEKIKSTGSRSRRTTAPSSHPA
jgi:competence protein ComEA